MVAVNSRMRVGFLVVKHLLCGGGIESYTYEVGKRLVARGHDVIVFSMGHYGDVSPMVEGIQSRPMTTPFSSASLALKVAATPMVAVSPWLGTRVRTPGGPSASRNPGIPSRGTPARYPACP